jgi:hypothetical protein
LGELAFAARQEKCALSFGKSQSVQIWSLADMLVHFCFRTCDAYRNLDFAINLLTFSSIGMATMDAKGQRATAKMAAEDVLAEGQRIGWELTDHVRTDRLVRDLASGATLSTETMVRELEGIKTSFHIALQKVKFAQIPAPDDRYFENEKLFGDAVFNSFEEARQDIKDSGNCLAASLYTACVFHLMRVSEFGLRRLARKLKVKLTDKQKMQPLEYAVWDKVITAIHTNIEAQKRSAAGPKKQAELSKFSEAGHHCTFMKNIWRNDVSHTRKPYIRDEALSAFARVNGFMRFLGSALER